MPLLAPNPGDATAGLYLIVDGGGGSAELAEVGQLAAPRDDPVGHEVAVVVGAASSVTVASSHVQRRRSARLNRYVRLPAHTTMDCSVCSLAVLDPRVR